MMATFFTAVFSIIAFIIFIVIATRIAIIRDSLKDISTKIGKISDILVDESGDKIKNQFDLEIFKKKYDSAWEVLIERIYKDITENIYDDTNNEELSQALVNKNKGDIKMLKDMAGEEYKITKEEVHSFLQAYRDKYAV